MFFLQKSHGTQVGSSQSILTLVRLS